MTSPRPVHISTEVPRKSAEFHIQGVVHGAEEGVDEALGIIGVLLAEVDPGHLPEASNGATHGGNLSGQTDFPEKPHHLALTWHYVACLVLAVSSFSRWLCMQDVLRRRGFTRAMRPDDSYGEVFMLLLLLPLLVPSVPCSLSA